MVYNGRQLNICFFLNLVSDEIAELPVEARCSNIVKSGQEYFAINNKGYCQYSKKLLNNCYINVSKFCVRK